MTRALNLVAVGALIFAGANVRADDATARTPAITRTPTIARTSAITRTPAIRRMPTLKQRAVVQLSACMTKRMVVNKAVTYYDAMKICQDKSNSLVADSASRAVLASVIPTTP